MAYLYDAAKADAGASLWKNPPGRRKLLKDGSYVVVQKRRPVRSWHGVTLIPDGDPIKVVCSVEDRAQQAGMFSISGAEDKKPQRQGGLVEVTPIQILAREWPGNIYCLIWYMGDLYDEDGAPMMRRSGNEFGQGVEVHARRIARNQRMPAWKGRVWGV